ncbi:hypothetical protein F5Y17DRAFT_240654 [Xylariaceae sp. FL0594]|nr:hypothetical protein F5Y17DRAFT_240654 [Xylariaceae sp. FL0594]
MAGYDGKGYDDIQNSYARKPRSRSRTRLPQTQSSKSNRRYSGTTRIHHNSKRYDDAENSYARKPRSRSRTRLPQNQSPNQPCLPIGYDDTENLKARAPRSKSGNGRPPTRSTDDYCTVPIPHDGEGYNNTEKSNARSPRSKSGNRRHQARSISHPNPGIAPIPQNDLSGYTMPGHDGKKLDDSTRMPTLEFERRFPLPQSPKHPSPGIAPIAHKELWDRWLHLLHVRDENGTLEVPDAMAFLVCLWDTLEPHIDDVRRRREYNISVPEVIVYTHHDSTKLLHTYPPKGWFPRSLHHFQL